MRIAFRSFVAVLMAAAVASCSDTKSITMPIAAGKHAAKIALNPVFSPAAKSISAALGDFGITYDHVRITIRDNPDTNIVVADTTVAFGPTSNALTLDLTVPVDQDGQIFNALVRYTGPTGVVFSGTILVQSYAPGGQVPEQQNLVLNFVGPGAKLKTITLSPKPVNLVGAQSIAVTATATDSSGASLAVPPLVFTSSDATVATVTGSATTYNAQSFGKRGQARIIATTPTGIADTLTANVTLPAAKIVLVSGGAQTGAVGTALTNPAVVQVNASDDIAVPGVSVTFAPPTGGSVGTTTVTTDAKGQASSTMTLATGAGPQSFLATAAGFNVAIPATAVAGPISPAQTLISATSPILADNTANSVVTVQARDQYQNLITTGGATINLSTTAGHFGNGRTAPTTIVATDKGDGTYTAQLFSSIGGPATVSGNVAGTAITATATVTFVAGTLDHFDVTTATGTAIGPTVQAGVALAVKITARDAGNNVIPSFTGQPKIRVTNSTLTPDSVITAPAAVSGVTTASVMLGSPGQNVTLDVTGTLGQNTVVSHSAVFAVTPAPAGEMFPTDPVVVSDFDSQLNYPEIQVRDAAGNAVAGQAVTFTLAALSSSSGSPHCAFPGDAGSLVRTTNSDGVITFDGSMLLYATDPNDPYSCLLLAQATGATGIPLFAYVPLVVRPLGVSTWVGRGGDAEWNNSKNWLPATAPTSASTVFIPWATSLELITTHTPLLSSDATIGTITLEDVGSVDLGGHSLTTSSVDGRTVGEIKNGLLRVTGTSDGTLSGVLPDVICSAGNFNLSKSTIVRGSMTNSGCALNFTGSFISIGGSYLQNGTGTVAMNARNDSLDISGTAVFGGASQSNALTNGGITLRGDFSQTGNGASFATSIAQRTHFAATSGSSRSVAFGAPSTSSFTNLDLMVTPEAGLTITTQIRVDTALTITAPNGGTLALIDGLVNTRNGPITINAPQAQSPLTINVGGIVNAAGLTFATGAQVVLNGSANFSLANGVLVFRANSHVTINSTVTFTVGTGGCSKDPSAVIDGTNTAAIGILNQVCRAP